MAVFKCKMCGGTINFNEGDTVGVCDHCGTKQTLPSTNDDIITNLYNRANNLRLKSEFDRASSVYEDIVRKDDSQAEAHWGIVLCKYGIEYVDDPATGKKIPTCHRTSYEAIRSDADYLAAVDYSDGEQQAIYEAEARAIDRIQKGILEIAKEEKPFDVFICYKETDENGKRTVDSAIANDIYYQLTQEGFKVFYAAITLEDKLGQEYEPYIFAALNSAKVMLVLGTKPEYFNAVWVKNEWSRYLKLIKNDRSKLLIPCYRDMDAYDLPEEFAHLQAQDMSKIGFINDVIRGIRKLLTSTAAPTKAAPVNTVEASNTAPLLKRAFMFLEDGDWQSADEYCEKVLDLDPENGEAYLGKLLAEYHSPTLQHLSKSATDFSNNNNFKKIVRFADKETLEKVNEARNVAIAYAKYNYKDRYDKAVAKYTKADTIEEFTQLKTEFQSLNNFFESKQYVQKCDEKIYWIQTNVGTLSLRFDKYINDEDFFVKIDGKKYMIGRVTPLDRKTIQLPVGDHVIQIYYTYEYVKFNIAKNVISNATINRSIFNNFSISFA
ncbi:MAG: toll/interleukin-1 receptor domain-containing protein [Clostridia bacterium]|nr:toll/interleukin-1 receptor domain-containing protein [Clostridia bacterium]